MTLKVADLSTRLSTTRCDTTASGSLLWIFRFTNGYQDAAAQRSLERRPGWTFGYNDYTVGSTPCEPRLRPAEKCVLFPGDQPIQGTSTRRRGRSG